MESKSKFTGNVFTCFAISFACAFLIAFTLGIATPWALTIRTRFDVEHTVIDGYRLSFDGKGIQLFGRFMLWILLCFVTFCIYSFWLRINFRKWVTKHTHFERLNSLNTN